MYTLMKCGHLLVACIHKYKWSSVMEIRMICISALCKTDTQSSKVDLIGHETISRRDVCQLWILLINATRKVFMYLDVIRLFYIISITKKVIGMR